MTLTDDITLPERPYLTADPVSNVDAQLSPADQLSREAELSARRIADFLQTVTRPERLVILSGLCDSGEATADELAQLLGEPREHVLRHLSGMLADGVVTGWIAADEARYRIAGPRLRRIVDRLVADAASPADGDDAGARVVRLRPSP